MSAQTNGDRTGPGVPIGARGARILVVEDTVVNQLLVERQLAKLGYEYEIVSEAEVALDLLACPDHGFDVVLMDWQLPGIDGLEATRRIRDLERDSERHVPIVALTASALSSDRLACGAAGMDDFLAKPASLTTLGEVLARWVSF